MERRGAAGPDSGSPESHQAIAEIIGLPENPLASVQVTDDQGREIVRPDVLQAVTQLAQLGQLVRIRRSLEREHIKGEIDNRTLDVTEDVKYLDLRRDRPYTPWVKATFYNDGPNAVFISLRNTYDDKTMELRLGETWALDFTKADERITLLYYWCASGEIASVRAHANY